MKCRGTMNEGVYNCYGEIDNSICYKCIYNSDSEEKMKVNKFVNIKDRLNVLYDYLCGVKLPEGIYCKMPKLSPKKAFTVIWFLQEVMHCLPDNIEQCQDCKELFDADSEGYHLNDQYEVKGKTLAKKYWGNWCENCVPYIEFELK